MRQNVKDYALFFLCDGKNCLPCGQERINDEGNGEETGKKKYLRD